MSATDTGVNTDIFFEKIPDLPRDAEGQPVRVPGNPGDYQLRLAQWTREKEIAEQTWLIKKDDLEECHRTNGENHYEQCKEIALEVFTMFRKPHFGALELVEKGTVNPEDVKNRHQGRYFK